MSFKAMRGREKDRAKPGLAKANLPFTPITRKAPAQAETPFQPLRLNDLETPKSNPSNSEPDLPSPVDSEPAAQPSDLQAILQGLKSANEDHLRCIARLEQLLKPKNYGTAATQTSGIDAPTQFEGTEVSPNDRLDPSPVGKAKPALKPRARPHQEERPRKPLAPVARNAMDTEPLEKRRGITKNQSTGDSLKASGEDENLQKRLHEMSLLLRRLENQLDGIEQCGDGVPDAHREW
jgi:hypothetical protein